MKKSVSGTGKTIPIISVANGTCCQAVGSQELLQAFISEVEKRNLQNKIVIKQTGCHGFSEVDPTVMVLPAEVFYCRLKPENVTEIIDASLQGRVVENLVYSDTAKKKYVHFSEIPFFTKQKKFLTANFHKINPLDINDYIKIGGYEALKKALKISSEEIIEQIKKSGLRGRGGAGFPTGKKWNSCKSAKGNEKYVICNADEGDPGAFMDRILLEGTPHAIVEGMIIGAHAVGSNQGYIYVRNEYPLAIEHLKIALKQAEEHGFLGNDILGSGFNFNIKISRGGGAFVCGESSSLRASIEGRIGEPSVKYVHATEKGLYDKPTVLNNVKTWATIPLIINKGAEWFSSIGTEKSKGTMIFSLVGKINNTGLVEVPMGIKLREMVYDIGGGIPDGKKLKAIQTGGPSGGCIPANMIDLPVDYEALAEVGSMMGSGGMIVMDETTCMVNIAKYFLDFTQEESCGKCTPCREGIRQMTVILDKIMKGKGEEGDIELLEEIGAIIKETSLCQLGGSAPNPVLTTIKYFRDEYESHIKDKKCPAKACRELIKYNILEDKCTGCHLCFKNCPSEAIIGKPKEKHKIIQEKCIKCGACYDVCKFSAVGVI